MSMEFAAIANALVVVGAVIVVVVALVASSVRRIGPDERLVVYRFGHADTSAMRGPGIIFLVPVIDSGVRVSLLPQHVALDAVPATTSDGRGVGVDLDLRFRVVRPLVFVAEVPWPFAAGLRRQMRFVLAHATTGLSLGDALEGGALEAAALPLIHDLLTRAGAADLHVRVARVRAMTTSEDDERAALVRLGDAFSLPDPDLGHPHTLRGDISWAVRRVAPMARWGIVIVAAVTLAVQVVGLAGLRPWTPISLFYGLFIGSLTVLFSEFRGEAREVYRKAGARRTATWLVVLVVATATTIGLLFLLMFAAGLDRVPV